MRLLRPAFNLFPSLQRLRDPQVQVWVMVCCSVLLVLIGHLHAWNASGEGKNDSRTSASHLLLAGARVQWSDEFAAAPRPQHRPVLNLGSTPFPKLKTPAMEAPLPDVRPAMGLASSRPWQALSRPLRSQLAQAGIPASPLQVRLRWSGESRGNAALVARHSGAFAPPARAGLVIGNGSRSRDGEIEMLFPRLPFGAGGVEITLIGPHGQPTPQQWSALAELLVHLEALSGNELSFAPAPPLSTNWVAR